MKSLAVPSERGIVTAEGKALGEFVVEQPADATCSGAGCAEIGGRQLARQIGE